MASGITPAGPPALTGPSTAYVLWSNTAKYHKTAIDRLTNWSIRLAIAGAILATGGEQVGLIKGNQILSEAAGQSLGKALGLLGSAAVAMAAFLSQRAQADNRVGIWARSRATAESLKSVIFLYRATVPPFDGPDRATQVAQGVEKATQEMHDVEPRQPDSPRTVALSSLTVDDYIKERAQDQIDWYKKRAREHQKSADQWRLATSVLAGIGALLTVASAVSAISAWAPVVATITASITAYLKDRHYQTLVATYVATALRLEALLDEWKASGKTESDTAERARFILRCEETMAAENGSWSALWTKQ